MFWKYQVGAYQWNAIFQGCLDQLFQWLQALLIPWECNLQCEHRCNVNTGAVAAIQDKEQGTTQVIIGKTVQVFKVEVFHSSRYASQGLLF